MQCTPFSVLARSRRLFLAVGLTFVLLDSSGGHAHASRFVTSKDRAQGDALYQQAFSAYQAGDYKQAQDLIDKAEAFKPDQPDGWNLRGMVCLKQNAFDKAETAFARAISLDPKLWAAQFNLAETPFQGKDYARARTRFEKLVDQTDRFKEPKQWELVQYKAFLSCLLMGDHAAADRKLEKLPAKGGVTPAYDYAQAALAFSRKDPGAARKPLEAAQGAYSPLLNDLFSNSLVDAGWQSPVPPPQLVVNILRPTAPSVDNTPVVIDPRLEASVAEPLPSAAESTVHPVMSKTTLAKPRAARSASSSPAPTKATPTPEPEATPEHRGLLLE